MFNILAIQDMIKQVIFLGNGLFCKEQIRRGQQIVHFLGKVLGSREEVLEAQQVSDHGGNVITNETDTWGLDCFNTAARQFFLHVF